jgi:hypothetical protein
MKQNIQFSQWSDFTVDGKFNGDFGTTHARWRSA